jgi:glucokinase
MILAGDVGGTKTVVGLLEESGDELRVVKEARYRNAEYDTFEKILDAFLAGAGRPALEAACFGIAGPVIDGRVQMANLHWSMDGAVLGERLNVRHMRLLNDLEAMAYGCLYLPASDFRELNLGPGSAPRRQGNIGVVAAGTGLGEALLYWDGTGHHPIASEGGHTSFAPSSELEVELLRYLWDRLGGHVSTERVLSGPGQVNIYEFLRDTGRGEEPRALRTRLEQGHKAEVITTCGLSGEFPICTQALELFVAIYGSEAGNLALKALTFGGLFIGGGIAPKILPKLTDGTFMRSFTAKGRRGELNAGIPVAVVLNTTTPRIGAGYFARDLCRKGRR